MVRVMLASPVSVALALVGASRTLDMSYDCNMKATSALVLMLAIPVSAGAGDTQGVAFDDGNEGGGGGSVPKAVWTRRLGLQFHDGCQEEAAVLRWVSR